MIIEDQLDRGVGRIGGIEKLKLEEFDEFAAPVAILDQRMDFAGDRIDPGQQARSAAWGSSIPRLALVPLHGYAGGVTDLDPDAARSGPVGTVNPLRNDSVGAKLASVRKDSGAILGNMFVKALHAPPKNARAPGSNRPSMN
jgi:hypothetical protein